MSSLKSTEYFESIVFFKEKEPFAIDDFGNLSEGSRCETGSWNEHPYWATLYFSALRLRSFLSQPAQDGFFVFCNNFAASYGLPGNDFDGTLERRGRRP